MAKRIRREKLDDDPDDEDEAADSLSKKKNGIVDGPIGTNGNILTKGGPGRPLGSTNLVPRSIKALIKEAMERHGSDGKGAEGALGYLSMLARDHKDLFVGLVRRTLPVQLKAEVEPGTLMAKLLQTAAATREMRANGSGNGAGNVIDITPSRTRRSYTFDDD